MFRKLCHRNCWLHFAFCYLTYCNSWYCLAFRTFKRTCHIRISCQIIIKIYIFRSFHLGIPSKYLGEGLEQKYCNHMIFNKANIKHISNWILRHREVFVLLPEVCLPNLIAFSEPGWKSPSAVPILPLFCKHKTVSCYIFNRNIKTKINCMTKCAKHH